MCLKKFRFSRGFVARTTWIHRFVIDRQEEEMFNFNEYPNIIRFEELSTRQMVQFQVAYFTISSNVQVSFDVRTGRTTVLNNLTHQTSVHWIEGRGWIYYDGIEYPQGTTIPSNLWKTHIVKSVTYIRKPE